MNAPVHVGDDQRSDIFVLDCPLELVVSAFSESIVVTVVLKIALSSLIANGAVERVVGQQKFHDTTASQSSVFRVGVNLHGWGDLRAAGGDRFG